MGKKEKKGVGEEKGKVGGEVKKVEQGKKEVGIRKEREVTRKRRWENVGEEGRGGKRRQESK